MLRRFRSGLTFSNVIALMALFVALGGGAYALTKGEVKSKHIAKNAVKGKHVKDNKLKGKDIDESTLSLSASNVSGAAKTSHASDTSFSGRLTVAVDDVGSIFLNCANTDVELGYNPPSTAMIASGLLSTQDQPTDNATSRALGDTIASGGGGGTYVLKDTRINATLRWTQTNGARAAIWEGGGHVTGADTCRGHLTGFRVK